MESDVTTTLSELERKLKELERELESVGRGGELDAEPAQASWTAPADPDAGAAGPPPAGATPFTAAWRGGGGEGASAGEPPASPYDGAQPVRVSPPPAPWGAAATPPRTATPFTPPPAQAAPPPAPAAPPLRVAAPFAPPPPPPPAGLHAQLDELLAFRDRLVQTTDDLVSELSRVLTELGVGAPDPADTLLSGDVVVEAAPFADLATLAAFEQALTRVHGVTDVYVRTLDAGRAAIDVRLAGPIALAAALRTVSPVPFTVTDVRDGRLTLALPSGA